MNQLVHADIFFFVTTIAVVIIAIGAVVVLVFVAQILREVRETVALVRSELQLVQDYMTNLRKTPSQGAVGAGMVAEGIVTLFNSFRKNESRQEVSNKSKPKTRK